MTGLFEISHFLLKLFCKPSLIPLFIALADHLHYAIERSREGISLQNPLAWEVRKFYPREYEIGKQALRLIAKDLEVQFGR